MIIPCYNESLNIPKLFNQIRKNQKKTRFEAIIIDNGSTDNSQEVIKKNKKKSKNIKIISIKKNIGFGHAVKIGILKSRYNLVCYTHGDLQIDIKNCLKAFKIFKKQKKEKIFVKGERIGRSIIDIFFTTGMSFVNTILFRTYLFDIHAQPNFFKKMSEKIINKAPDDMSIDLFFYAFFKLNNYKIFRFDIFFEKRIYGIGSNIGFKKLTNTFRSLINSVKILNKI